VAQQAGLVKLGHVALDGTKVRAHTSKHKAMSYDRVCREEAYPRVPQRKNPKNPHPKAAFAPNQRVPRP